MPTQVRMPQFGESVEEGTITRWLKAEGDSVQEFEPLVEVNTDKVDTEIPSPSSGTLLKILVPEGEVAHAGTVLAWVGESGESVPDEDQAPGESEPEPAIAPEERAPAEAITGSARPGRDQKLGFISPVVARIAQEHNIDLSQVPGTGREGRITKKDVLSFIERLPQAEPEVAPVSPAEEPAQKPAPVAAPGALISLSPVRRAIAEHMVASRRTSPHVTTVMEADLSQVVAHRAAHKEEYSRSGANLTFTAYIVSACVAALRAYPMVNSSWSENGIQLQRGIHIGIATALEQEGLIVPVIKDADGLSLLGIVRAVNDLSARARAKKLIPDEVRGGTFTITNHGTSGSLFATPIINQPQCAILGVGLIQKRVVVIDDAIAIRPMVYLSLTFDHRILDGAVADAFLAHVIDSLQRWE